MHVESTILVTTINAEKEFCDNEFKKNLVKSCKKAFNGFVFAIQKAECTHVVANLYLAVVKGSTRMKIALMELAFSWIAKIIHLYFSTINVGLLDCVI